MVSFMVRNIVLQPYASLVSVHVFDDIFSIFQS